MPTGLLGYYRTKARKSVGSLSYLKPILVGYDRRCQSPFDQCVASNDQGTLLRMHGIQDRINNRLKAAIGGGGFPSR